MLKDERARRRRSASTARKCGRSPTSRSSWSTNFAAQAVIAIENTRLLSELRTRFAGAADRDLGGAAASFRARRRSGAGVQVHAGERDAHLRGQIWHAVPLRRGEASSRRRHIGAPPALVESAPASAVHSSRGRAARRSYNVWQTKQIAHSRPKHDAEDAENPVTAWSSAARARLVGVPMLKDGELIGTIVIYRQEVRPFTDKQIELVTELRRAGGHRHRERAAAQRAARNRWSSRPRPRRCSRSSARSPGDLEPVFTAMLDNAARICEAKWARCCSPRATANSASLRMHGAPPAFVEKRTPRAGRSRQSPLNNVAIVAKTKQVQHVADLTQDPSYIEREAAAVVLADMAGARTLVVVPMLKDNELVGVIRHLPAGGPAVHRQADRAADELRRAGRHRHREHAAAQRVARELAGAADRDLGGAEGHLAARPASCEPVFEAMLENATRICEAKIRHSVWLCEDDALQRVVDASACSPAYAEYRNAARFRPGPATGIRSPRQRTKQTVHIVDTLDEQAYADRDPVPRRDRRAWRRAHSSQRADAQGRKS